MGAHVEFFIDAPDVHVRGGEQQWVQTADTVHAIQGGQVQVHENNVRRRLRKAIYCVFPRGVVAHALGIQRTVDPANQQFAGLGVIFYH